MNKYTSLTPEVLNVLKNKGTELPFSGKFVKPQAEGTYLCRGCGIPLFKAQDQFQSHCGWPSFDQEITGNVKRTPDPDGMRTEIQCMQCQGHLGHVFEGEELTAKNQRFCVNSVSLDYVQAEQKTQTAEAIVAGGCFWGVEYLFQQKPGVLKTEVGYCGGLINHPTYEGVCTKASGHYEATRIVYDPNQISYEEILRYFFEIHDPTQTNGQGPDHGPQYLSAIFYFDAQQKQIAEALKQKLISLGYAAVTMLLPVAPFWPAEDYHQNYYHKTGHEPYCHFYVKRFPE